MLQAVLSVCFMLITLWSIPPDKPTPSAYLNVTQLRLEAVPGATFSNQITLTNNTDEETVVALQLSAPAAFRLLTSLPATVRLAPHTTRRIPIKFLVARDWTEGESVVRIETVQQRPAAASAIEFLVRQSEAAPGVLTFTLTNETPFVVAGQDALPATLQFSNTGHRPRTVRIKLYSMPQGFRLALPHHQLTVPARRDTLVTLPLQISGAVQWDHTYELVLEVQDTDGPLLGSVVCRPVLLASTKRWQVPIIAGDVGNGVAVAYGRLGRLGAVRELRFWGRDTLGRGSISYQAHYLNYANQRYHELRDTYLYYQRDDFQLRVGSLYDFHELPLIGLGIKLARTVGNQRLEGWALRNQPNWLAGLSANVALSAPADQTYSLRLSGGLPLPGEATYEVSSSFYTLRRTGREGFLTYGSAQWTPKPTTQWRLLAGNSIEYERGATNRQQTTGWAVGGGYDRITDRLEVRTSAYFSSPVYGGVQRGASLIEHSLLYKSGPRTRLSYRYSQMAFNQLLFGLDRELISRAFVNTVAEVGVYRQTGRWGWSLRPYYWLQGQTLPGDVGQRAQAYRLLTSLRYQSKSHWQADLGFDAGRYQNVMPATDRFVVPSYRLMSSVGTGAFYLLGIYQRGPFLINDWPSFSGQNAPRLPGQTDPRAFRQLALTPMVQFWALDRRLQANVGLGLNYNSLVRAWSAVAHQTAVFRASDALRVRLDVNALSFAERLTDVTAVPWQDTQARLEVIKLMQRAPWRKNNTLRLRFYEDENSNNEHDRGEPLLEGLVVNVGATSLLTDRRGSVSLKALAAGAYRVQAVCKLVTGEPVFYADTVRFSRSAQHDIPIRKTYPLRGRLRCHQSKYETQSCELEQYRIETRTAAGTLYRTYADADGQFTLYLPTGEYELMVSSAQHPASRKTVRYVVESAPGNVVNASPAAPELRIDLDPTTRPVNIKRFTAAR